MNMSRSIMLNKHSTRCISPGSGVSDAFGNVSGTGAKNMTKNFTKGNIRGELSYEEMALLSSRCS